MTCPRCKSPYNGLACDVCLAARSREAYLRQQTMFLPDVMSGRQSLRLARRGRSGDYHIELINEPTHAYCSIRLDPPLMRDEWNTTKTSRGDVCGQCLEVLTSCIEAMEAAT